MHHRTLLCEQLWQSQRSSAASALEVHRSGNLIVFVFGIWVGGTAPPRGSAAATANMRRRRTTGGGASGGAAGTMLQFYTDDAPGLKISPNVVLVMSIGFIAFVAILHVMGKLYFVRREA
ncbi:hypothetical protein VNO80_25799 [Phaseolus coccineus]|uniref:Protein transport protein Sec61 subunit beta n=1 Tax=Phaseolus coccineus TaxID=3886 RepID=A0AAN9QTQ2_PHACN